MTDPNAILAELEAAKAKKFHNITGDNARRFLKHLGVEYSAEDKYPDLIRRLQSACGVTADEFVSVVKPAPAVRSMRSHLVPEYNLHPERPNYGGRRHIVKVNQRNDQTHSDVEKMFTFFENGYRFECNKGEPVSMPEPIWIGIRDAKKPVATRKEIAENGVIKRVTTEITMADLWSYAYVGVDPEFADRCASLAEWYQQKGVEFFRHLKMGELRIIATEIGVPHSVKDGDRTRLLTADELRDTIYLAVYGDIPYFEDAPETVAG